MGFHFYSKIYFLLSSPLIMIQTIFEFEPVRDFQTCTCSFKTWSIEKLFHFGNCIYSAIKNIISLLHYAVFVTRKNIIIILYFKTVLSPVLCRRFLEVNGSKNTTESLNRKNSIKQ